MGGQLQDAVPVLRIFDEALAREFYLDYLGFTLDWEHRFEDGLPLYAQVSRDGVRLHLTEHHGDATPGSTVLVGTADVSALHAELAGRPHPRLRPGVEVVDWGLELTVVDPFGNRIRFHQPGGERHGSLGPIRHELVVPVSPAVAFEAFTERLGEWWDAAYTPDPDSYTGASVEPRIGGTVALVHGESSYPIGAVTRWTPGERYGQTFTLAIEADHPTLLDVAFEELDGGCRVSFEHAGWTAGNAHCRERFGDWPHLLGRYAALVGG